MKTYQVITMGGKDTGRHKRKKGSKFYNEGRWNNFIKPHLPQDCKGMTFVELGCNVGLFLKLAKQHGFERVVGVDKSRSTFSQAQAYKKEHGLDYKILNKKVNKEFDYDEIPAADVTVMSNFHYYLTIDEILLLLDKMKFKTRYCIIVTADIPKKHWRARADLGSLRHYFKDWREIKTIYPIRTGNDPYPREMSSIMFESSLERMPIQNIWRWTGKRRGIGNIIEIARKVAVQDKVENLIETSYFKEKSRVNPRWRGRDVLRHMNERIGVMYDVKKEGLKEPLFVRSDGHLIEGNHRLVLLKELGRQSVIVRKV